MEASRRDILKASSGVVAASALSLFPRSSQTVVAADDDDDEEGDPNDPSIYEWKDITYDHVATNRFFNANYTDGDYRAFLFVESAADGEKIVTIADYYRGGREEKPIRILDGETGYLHGSRIQTRGFGDDFEDQFLGVATHRDQFGNDWILLHGKDHLTIYESDYDVNPDRWRIAGEIEIGIELEDRNYYSTPLYAYPTVHPKGEYFAIPRINYVEIREWDAGSPEENFEKVGEIVISDSDHSDNPVTDISFNSDGSRFVVMSGYEDAKVFDWNDDNPANPEHTSSISAESQPGYTAEWNHDDTLIATGWGHSHNSGHYKINESETSGGVHPWITSESSQEAVSIAWSPDNRWVAIGTCHWLDDEENSGVVEIVYPSDWEDYFHQIEIDHRINSIEWTDYGLYVTGGLDSTVIEMPDVPPIPGTLKGSVYDLETGDPLEDAIIEVTGIEDGHTLESDEEGYFETELDPDPYYVTAISEEFETYQQYEVYIEQNQEEDLEFYLDPDGLPGEDDSFLDFLDWSFGDDEEECKGPYIGWLDWCIDWWPFGGESQ